MSFLETIHEVPRVRIIHFHRHSERRKPRATTTTCNDVPGVLEYVLKDGKARWSKQHGDAVCRQSATCWRVACVRVRLVGVWRVLANLITLGKKIAREMSTAAGGHPATPGAGGGVSEGGS